jgi:nitroreductase
MNEVLQAISTRRSVRSYEQKPLSREVIEALIKAANEAPSAMNSQPWRFVIVQNPDFKKRLVETALPAARKYLEPIKETNPSRYELIMKRFSDLPDPIYYSAPVLIFIIGSGGYADNSCPLACQNIMLAAHSLGLGSCWVALGSRVTDNPEIVKTLGLTEGEKIFGPIVIGYPKDFPAPPPKKDPVVLWI